MRRIKGLCLVAISGLLAGCTATAATYAPVPGSITYNGQPRSKLVKAPVGSTFDHRFRDQHGYEYVETYRLRPDRSLEIIARHRIDFFFN